MGYREEREALRARADAMEQELSQARGELRQAQQELAQARQSSPWERLEQLERDLAAAQRAVQELRTQMTATERPTRPGTGRGPAVGAADTVGPIVFPTGPWEDPDRIGEEPPKDPEDTGGICPGTPGSF